MKAASWEVPQGPRTSTPLTLPCMQGMGQLSRESGKSCSTSGSWPELLPTAPDPTPIWVGSQGPSLCRVLGQRGEQLPLCCPALD